MPTTTIATNLSLSTTGTSPTVTVPSGLADSFVSITMNCPANGSIGFVCESSPDGSTWKIFHDAASTNIAAKTEVLGTTLNLSVGLKVRVRVMSISGTHTITTATVKN